MEESEGFNLIDVSSESDSLIAAAADDPSSELPRQSSDLSTGSGQQFSQPFEIAQPESLKKTGFLDAEDISTMIDEAEKGRHHLLPGIDEDINRSTDSISTLLSENLTLQSLEAELFEDIRASIQKSGKASGITNSNQKAAEKETDKPVRCSVKKVDATPRNRPNFWTETEKAIRRAYRVTDKTILYNAVDLGYGGSTAVTAILINYQKLVVASVGDSRAVICKNGVAKQLSVDHEPDNEHSCIEDRGGFVSKFPGDVPRVDGQLIVARAFDDKILKEHLS